jgi:hypothetical protein
LNSKELSYRKLRAGGRGQDNQRDGSRARRAGCEMRDVSSEMRAGEWEQADLRDKRADGSSAGQSSSIMGKLRILIIESKCWKHEQVLET